MKIKVKVKQGAGKEAVEKIGDGEYFVSLKEKAEDGKANRRLINLLARKFNVHFSAIKIKNPRSRSKIVEIKERGVLKR